MAGLVRRHEMLGRDVIDADGRFVGTVRDTHPLDGGGEVRMLLIGVGRRFPRERYVPTAGVRVQDGKVVVPVRRDEIIDCPSAEECRWDDPAEVARAYWESPLR